MKVCKDFSLGSSFGFEDVFGSGSAPCIMYLVHLHLILDLGSSSLGVEQYVLGRILAQTTVKAESRLA